MEADTRVPAASDDHTAIVGDPAGHLRILRLCYGGGQVFLYYALKVTKAPRRLILAEFVQQLPDHTIVAATNRSGAPSGHLLVHFRTSLPEAFYPSRRAFSLCIVLNHDDFDLTTRITPLSRPS